MTRVLEQLNNAGAADVAVVEDFSDTSIEDAEEMVNQSEDTISILSKFIDGLSVDVDSDKLKKLMRELYVESLNVEIIE